ncbi:MAG TPA: GAF domain-containing protein, partial [Chloroflexi bacterium]|nr:GAF domain-containing protein [Chloroflexota bacterium]
MVSIMHVTIDVTDQLSSLLEVSRSVTSTLELEPLLGLILDKLKTVVDYTGAAVMTLEGEDLVIRAYQGPIPQEDALQLRFPLERAPVNREVIHRREPVIIPDVRGDTPLARAFQETAGEALETTFGYIRSWMGVPLLVKERVIGMLTLDYDEPDRYSAQQAELALAFANQAAVAIENARLFAQARQRMRELEALYQAEEKLNRVEEELYRRLRLDLVLQTLVDVAVELLQADKSSLMVWDAQQEKLVVRAAHGFSPETMARMSFALGEGIVGHVAASGEPMVVEDTRADLCVARRITEPEGIRSFMHVPIKIGEQVFGVFNVSYIRPRAFNADDRRLFLALAQRAALAIENARLYEQAQQAATLEERQRVARELHDSVAQAIYGITLYAEAATRLLAAGKVAKAAEHLRELRDTAQEALRDMRLL